MVVTGFYNILSVTTTKWYRRIVAVRPPESERDGLAGRSSMTTAAGRVDAVTGPVNGDTGGIGGRTRPPRGAAAGGMRALSPGILTDILIVVTVSRYKPIADSCIYCSLKRPPEPDGEAQRGTTIVNSSDGPQRGRYRRHDADGGRRRSSRHVMTEHDHGSVDVVQAAKDPTCRRTYDA